MLPFIFDGPSELYPFPLAAIDFQNPFFNYGIKNTGYILKSWNMKQRPLLVFKKVNTSNLNILHEIVNSESYMSLPDYTFMFSEHLTQASGWAGRKWEAPRGNLHISLLLKPQTKLNRKNLNLLRISIINGVIKSLETHIQTDISIKLPSDIMVGNKKIGGIIEKGYCGFDIKAIIFGIGLNINKHPKVRDIPNSFIKGVDSLSNIAGRDFILSDMLLSIADNIIRSCPDIKYINDHLYGTHQTIELYRDVPEGLMMKKGLFLGINEEGDLLFADSVLKSPPSFRIAVT